MVQPLNLKYPVLVVAGPTASGKSEVAQILAERLDGEVVSADSMQVYRFMDVGTAKVPVAERRVAHHLIDVVDPGRAYSAQLYQNQARAAFQEIDSRGKHVVLCGGTGFYIQAALEDMQFPAGEQEENPLRREYEQLAEERGGLYLWEKLKDFDPESAAAIHPNNTKRVIRALEMASEGVSYAQQSRNIKQLPAVVPSVRFVLDVEVPVLNERIEQRTRTMFANGLVAEVERLVQQGFSEALTAPQAIGYKEVVEYLEGQISLEEAQDKITLATRRYAKRQRSWFRRDADNIFIDATDGNTQRIADDIYTRYMRECEAMHG